MIRSSRQMWFIAATIAFIPLAIRLLYYPDYPGGDDAFIHLAIIESIWNHHTFGINPGVNVNLSTSPLFILFFATLHVFTHQVMVAGIVLSSLAVFATIFLTYLLARRLQHHAVAALCTAALAATNIHLWRWGGTFMEVSFACLLVILALYVFFGLPSPDKKQNSWRSEMLFGLLMGVMVLIRPETGLLAPAVFLHDVINGEKSLLRKYAVIAFGLALPLLTYSLFAWHVFGAILPSTFMAKTNTGFILLNPRVLRSVMLVVASGLYGVLLIVLACVLWSRFGKHGQLKDGQDTNSRVDLSVLRKYAVFVIFPALMFVFYYLKMPFMQSAARYLLPMMSCLPFVALAAIQSVSSGANISGRLPLVRVMMLAALAQFTTAFYLNEVRVAPVLARMWPEYVATMTEAAAEIERCSQAKDVILVHEDIGVLAWRLGGSRVIADGGALASPELRGYTLAEKLHMSGAMYVLESLGTLSGSLQGDDMPPLTLVWERSFKSHSVEYAKDIYYTRLYKVGPK